MTIKYIYTFIFILIITVLGLLTPPYFVIGLYGGFYIAICFALFLSFFLIKGLITFREMLIWDWFNLALLLSISTFVSQVFNVFLFNNFHDINEAFFLQIIRGGAISSLIGFPLLLWIPLLVILAFKYAPKSIQKKIVLKQNSPYSIKTRIVLSSGLITLLAFFLIGSSKVAELDKLKSTKDYKRVMERYSDSLETGKNSTDTTSTNEKSKLKLKSHDQLPTKKENISHMVKTIFEDMVNKTCFDIKNNYAIHENDLNFDGNDEVIVFYWGPCFCGTGGCNTQVYQRSNNTLRPIGNFTLTRVPFYLKKEPNHNWKDLVFFKSGGGLNPTQNTYRFKNGKYELLQEKKSSNSLYQKFITSSKTDKNLERIFDDAYKKIYGKAFNK